MSEDVFSQKMSSVSIQSKGDLPKIHRPLIKTKAKYSMISERSILSRDSFVNIQSDENLKKSGVTGQQFSSKGSFEFLKPLDKNKVSVQKDCELISNSIAESPTLEHKEIPKPHKTEKILFTSKLPPLPARKVFSNLETRSKTTDSIDDSFESRINNYVRKRTNTFTSAHSILKRNASVGASVQLPRKEYKIGA